MLRTLAHWEERVYWPPAWFKMVSSRFKERLFNKRGRKGRQALDIVLWAHTDNKRFQIKQNAL